MTCISKVDELLRLHVMDPKLFREAREKITKI